MELSGLPPVLLKIAKEIQDAGGRCFLVGGWVRDHLLFLPCKDFDVEVYQIEQEVLQKILSSYGKPNNVGKAFGITLLKVGEHQFDFAFPRTETKVGKGHKGFSVVPNPNLSFREAAWRRDFTINAMGISLPDGELKDEYGGQKDLEDRVLRHVSEAFGEDPLRALRALQFAARFDLHVLPETVKICAEQDLSELSVERIDEEMRKLLLKSPKPSMGLVLWRKMQLTRFFPEFQFTDKDWTTLLSIVDKMASLSLEIKEDLRVAQMFATLICLLEETQAKAFLSRISRHLECTDKSLKIAKGARQLRMAFKDSLVPTQGWIRRQALLLPLHEQALLADVLYQVESGAESGLFESKVRSVAEKFGVWDVTPSPWLAGKDLLEMGLKPGPHFGNWIQKAFDLQLDGKLKSREEALLWMKEQLK